MATDPVPPPQGDDALGQEADEPFSLSGTSTALSGLVIALLSVSLPLFAVVAERAAFDSGLTPTASESHGSATSAPLSLTRADQSFGRNTRWQSQ